jgi:hypothetical protein
MFTSKGTVASCVVSVTKIPKGTPSTALSEMRNGIQYGLLRSVGGRALGQSTVTYGGMKGQQLKFESDTAHGTLWTAITPTKVYTLTIGMQRKRMPDLEKRFFQSFKLMK